MSKILLSVLWLIAFAGSALASGLAIIEVDDHASGNKSLWVDCTVNLVVGYDGIDNKLDAICDWGHTQPATLPTYAITPYQLSFGACGGFVCVKTRDDCTFVGEVDSPSGTRIITISCGNP